MKNFLIIVLLFEFVAENYGWNIGIERNNFTIHMDEELKVPFNITTSNSINTTFVNLEISSEDKNVVTFNNGEQEWNGNLSVENGVANGEFTLKAVFLGRTNLLLTLGESSGSSEELPSIKIIVMRKERVIDHVFTGSVALLVALIYINFGCALNWSALKPMLKRPIGPAIGFVGQFVVMPVLAFCVGLLIFPDNPEMRLGMLFAGVSPAGGASNVWTVILDGNIDLSVTMTTISTIAAFGMMPLWVFTVGPQIFDEAKIEVPYSHILSLAAALILPLFIGWLIKHYLPRLAALLVRILKGFSALLILFIVAFAIATNLYLFRLATWQIAVAGLLLPWCGYLLGAALAALFKQPARDIMAIAIETGVQNTGIAIFLLRFSLPQPEADLTTIVPVAVAVMTPIPLTCLFLYKKISQRMNKNKKNLDSLDSDDLSSIR